MISVIHKHGTSFAGLGRYLFHDIGADTDERVAWVEMENLATENRRQAVRIMIATALQQDELKRRAGVGPQGRQSNAHVMHYTLSWHQEESKELTKEEMLAAAKASMVYLGTTEGEYLGMNKKTGEEIRAKRTQYADEHQSIIVCHQEEGKSPHVHIMLNRVHPEHGVMLPTSKEREKLSAWSLDYRQSQGKEHYCPQRVINAAKRAEGYVTSCKRKSRQIYELEQQHKAAAERDQAKQQLLEQVRAAVATLAAKRAQLEERARASTRMLEENHLRNEQLERDRAAHEILEARSQILKDHEPVQDELLSRQQREIAAFEEAQKTLRGRVAKTWEVFNTRTWMQELREKPVQVLKEGFALAFSSGMQRQQLEAYHADEQRRLTNERKRREHEQAQQARAEMGVRLEQRRQLYLQERNDLMLAEGMDRAKHRAEWAELRRDRAAVLSGEGQTLRRRSASPTLGANDNVPDGSSRPTSAGGKDQSATDSNNATSTSGAFNDAADGRTRDVAGDDTGAADRQAFLDQMNHGGPDLGEGQSVD